MNTGTVVVAWLESARMNVEERRQFERISKRWAMTLDMPGAEYYREAETLNVSASGIAVEVEGEMLMAGNVEIAFEDPEELAGLLCHARIVWVGSGPSGTTDHARIGLHFLDMAEQDRAKLRRLLYGSADARSRPGLKALVTRTAEGLAP